MPTQLLSTKLYVPRAWPRLVSRPRLIARLNAGLDRKLTLISAPAGYGKTTLLAEWTDSLDRLESGLQVAWVSLDDADNDPVHFWAYFIAALQTIDQRIGQDALAALESPRPPSFESVLTLLINEVAERAIPCAVVLDDYHVIAAAPVTNALSFLLDHLPPSLHLVIASRADPPLSLSRLRGRGELIELRAADLSFTPDEADAFLNEVMGLALSAGDVAALEARTEGWIVGLQMAALALQGATAPGRPADASSFVAAFTGSHATVADYLGDEVLARLPAGLRTFALETSILRRMCGPLCDAVRLGSAQAPGRSFGTAVLAGRPESPTGSDGPAIITHPSGQQTLDELMEANMFVVPLDDERRWFRYHHLFASLLRRRLEQTWPDSVPRLHRRASAWYEQSGLVAEAVEHALKANDLDRVERIVADRALAMIYQGELATLMSWLEALPHRVVRSRPWLCVAYAWVLAFAGKTGDIEPVLRDAETALREIDAPSRRQHVAGHIAAIRAHRLAQERDHLRAEAHSRDALQLLPTDDMVVRSFATAVAGNAARRRGDLIAASRATAESVALARPAGARFLVLDGQCDLARLQRTQGQLRNAAATCYDALRLAGGVSRRGGQPLPIAGRVSAWLSLVLREWNDLEAARRYAGAGIDACTHWGEPSSLGMAYLARAKACQALGDGDGALASIAQARRAVATLPPSATALVAAWEMQIRLAQGDVADPSRWTQASGLSAGDDIPFYRHEEYHTLAQILIAQGELRQALVLLAGLLDRMETAGALGCVIEVLVLEAIALQATGDLDESLTPLERALTLAEPEGYVRTFIDHGAPMGDLLRRAVVQGVAPHYASQLIAALEAEVGCGPGETRTSLRPSIDGSPSLIEPLSDRELELLRMLPSHLTRREIADALFISVNTARFHIKNIYAKLGVHSRSEAIQRAEKLGLI